MTSPRCGDLELSRATRALRERVEGFRVYACESIPFAFHPAFELGESRNAEPVEEGAAVARHGALQRAFGDGLLVCPDVDRDDVWVESKGGASRSEHVRRQGAPEREYELFEVVSRAVLVELRPEQR